MSSSRSESDLAINIRKATSIEETAPKRKHVRAAIVYTWDHKSSQSFWAGMKVQPILADEIQTFKALITIHRVLQEGHKVALEEAQSNIDWLKSLARGTSSSRDGYGSLIKEYVAFLVLKLAFHREHRQFNGLFEYEEVVSLRTVNDPDSGYQAISSLMNLQDQIENFQKSIFASFRYGGNNNECRIAGLVPLVLESYGIYRFITSMLRAMHTITDNSEALAPLVENFNSQFYRLRHFYYECANLKYLTSLISVPKLPSNPPNLQSEEDAPPGLPARPKNETPKPREPSPPPAPPKPAEITPEPMNNWWEDEQRKQQEQYDAQQRALQQQWQQQQFDQQQSALRQQQDFENQQRLLAEQQRLAQEQFQREQAQAQISGRMAELEQENMNARAQYERDQLMLKQYDQQVKDLEEQLQTMRNNFTQQIGSKDDQIRALQEQVNTWRTKYEALAKLYSQLRTEHLELLQKFKNVQLKAASAQEAIDKKEKLERELKTKNLELADMIRERDRALHDRDRLQGGNKEELEKLKRELRMALDRADDAERAKGNELSAMLSRYNREMADLEEALRVKTRALDDFSMKNSEGNSDLERLLREREEELEIMKSAMDQTLLDLHAAQTNGGDTDKAMDEQIDMVLLAQVDKINSMIDSVLQAGMQRIDDAVYELDSSMTAGNQNATAPYVLSQIEKASSSVSEFSMAFNNFIADGPGSEHAEIIKTINVYAGAIADVLSNTKGLTRFASEEKSADQLVNTARTSAQAARNHFRSLQSANLGSYSVEEKIDVVINLMHEVLMALQKLSKLADAFTPKNAKLSNQSGDIGDVVDRELANAAKAIDAAVERLNKLRNKPRSGLKEYEIRIHDSILEAALAVTGAISQLIKAATAAQQEIVAKGRGSSSKTSFYKKNNRWTEGLISAAKAVANSTNTLIETADAVIVRNANMERLIVASNDVAASTAQLVAASRVKADFGSRTQDTLEEASKAVGRACRSLVRKVQEILKEREDSNGADKEDFAAMDRHEFKIKEMEQQVEILQLENALGSARKRLGEMRKISYQEE